MSWGRKGSDPRAGEGPADGSRRLFVSRVVSFSALALAAPTAAVAAREERVLSFFHTHTSDRLTLPYFADGAYLPRSLARLDHFLRDLRTGEEHAIDPTLYDILHALRELTGTRQPFHVISGFRSAATNARLRSAPGSGVARASLHLQGQAIDIRLGDVSSAILRDAALELGRGGVGYYRQSDFVHVDTGRVRAW
ncbi:MAG TPA: DUF882 domain-containing protein [Vicinamibacteria bacterium]|nr:DUF882 domain-containing protein [Vicinamibacteria bacterium]